MTLSEELQWRGFVNQTSLDDLKKLDTEPLSFYWGVDPSADSMTIGNLAPAMMVRHFIDHGHKAFLLVGGATGMIGDPDGKKDERNLKTTEEIAKNKAGLAAQYKTIFAGKTFDVVDNYDWFKDFNYLDFLRQVGKHVPLSNMLGRDFIQARLGEGGSGISYAEFSYSLIQGYDFLHLFNEHGVTLQLSGADQWGNVIAGVDLVRRVADGEAHALTMPLIINKSTGVKFGKSEGGAVWLDAEKTSVYKFYQFWLNVDDESAPDLLKKYTLLTKEQVDELIARQRQNPGARDIQKTLAHEVTKLIHGEERTESVKRVTDVLFGAAAFDSLNDADIDALAAEIPTVTTPLTVIEALQQAAVATSNGEARRLISGNAVSVNGQRISEDQTLARPALIKKGKNSFILAR